MLVVYSANCYTLNVTVFQQYVLEGVDMDSAQDQKCVNVTMDGQEQIVIFVSIHEFFLRTYIVLSNSLINE